MENKEFKPYVPADKVTPEFTATSIIIGVLLAIILARRMRILVCVWE